jgi:hypothetical protein
LSPLGWFGFELRSEIVGPILIERIEFYDRCRAQISDRQLDAMRLRIAIVGREFIAQSFEFLLRRQSGIRGAAESAGVDDRRPACGRSVGLRAYVAQMVERMISAAKSQLSRRFCRETTCDNQLTKNRKNFSSHDVFLM